MTKDLSPDECKAIIYLVNVQTRMEIFGFRKPSLRVMENIYAPNRFYLTFPNDDS